MAGSYFGFGIMPKGFTLIELMVTIAILGIMATLSFPMLHWFERIEAKMAAQTLHADLLLAQKKALSENRSLSLCPSSNTQSCDNVWKNQYIVFFSETDKLAWSRTLNKNIRLSYQGFPTDKQIDYQPTNIQNTNGTLTIAYHSRAYYRLVFNQAGRVRLEVI